MILPDVNVLIYATREDAETNSRYAEWLAAVLSGPEPFGYSELALSAVVRIITNPKLYKDPTPISTAFAFAEQIRSSPNAVSVRPGIRHWDIFHRLCEESAIRGNLVTDAYFAALAIEHDCEWITVDRDYRRFQGLRWRRPF